QPAQSPPAKSELIFAQTLGALLHARARGARIPGIGLAGWLWIGVLAANLAAGHAPPLSVETLASKAELVVRGRVLSQSVQRTSDGWIYTEVQLLVREVWKGQPDQNPIRVCHSGGAHGARAIHVPGQVRFTDGEESVLFLVRNRLDRWVPVGMSQGKFKIEPVAGPGLAAGGRSASAEPPDDSARVDHPMLLEQGLTVRGLRQRIQEAVR
ncbi:MAG TPA: hypothetical protein P5555_15935, partial [Candidatus Paceibacterota bacterium]|nr:hypothetical protein [Candidatus Paceibacterota bacterium]